MANIRVEWNDRNWIEQGHHIYRSLTPMDVSNMPVPIATVGKNVTFYDDYDVIEGTEYYYRIGAYINNDVAVSNEFSLIAEEILHPGPQVLMAGDMTDGFFGEVPVTELFSGDELASIIGLTAGTAQYSNDPWLKFAIDNKIIYVAKKAYRHSVSWSDINAVNAVYDDMNSHVVSVDGFNMKVRLITGADADPTAWTTTSTADNNFGAGSEWNRLMYRIHQDVPITGTTVHHGGPQVGGNWVSYVDSDIGIRTGNGIVSWTQETPLYNSGRKIFRGGGDIHTMYADPSSSATTLYGWRPVLELQL